MKSIFFKPIDIAFLVYFRILAASLISFELINSLLIGDIQEYTSTNFSFSYQLVPFLNPWSELGLYVHYFITIIAGFLVAAGYKYRYTTIIFFLGFTSLFLLEETDYVNHTYLYCLISFWMIFMPANRAFSYDSHKDKSIESSVSPSWCYYLLLLQIGIVYFFAGVAKINIDWLDGRPMNMVMPYQGDTFLLGPLLVLPGAHYFISYAGMIFDLTIFPLLLWNRTRTPVFILAIMFHVSNALIFGLATFPWFSIMMSSLFFNPSWPRKLPLLKKYLPDFNDITIKNNNFYFNVNLLKNLIIFYVVVQILLPLRHWLYPGNVNWTEEGHYFSWRMMLRSKTGTLHYEVHIPSSDTTIVENPMDHITKSQYQDLIGKPELIIQYAHFLADKHKKHEGDKVMVNAISSVSLNGRPRQALIDPEVDLASEKRSLKHYGWIVPLVQREGEQYK